MPDTFAPRPRATLAMRGETLCLGTRTFVMGILNVTPDSFSGDGLLSTSLASSPEELVPAALRQAARMVAEGADIIDVGGESTRPGHQPITEAEELARVVDVVAAIRELLPDVPISVDTIKASVAHAALDAGADMLNDVGAMTAGGGLAVVAAERAVPYVLMHARDRPRYRDVVTDVMADLRDALDRAEGLGCSPERLIVDPGIGFGKTASQNLALLRDLHVLQALGRPMLLGTSRKSTIGRVLDLPPEDRLEGTLATTALAIAGGVDIVRVHDVAPNVRVARMSDAIVRGTWHDGDGQKASPTRAPAGDRGTP